MEGQQSDYHNANSFAQNELDQSTSTSTLVRGNTPWKPLKPVVQHYLKALIKVTRQETKAVHHLETLKKALENRRPPKGLTPSIKHNISKAPPHLVIQWYSILHETGEKLTKVLVDYWNDQKLAQGLEFEQLQAELEEREQIDSETWQQSLEILEKIKDGVQEEQKLWRPANRIIKQASKVRLIEPAQSLNSIAGSSLTQSTNPSMEPKPPKTKGKLKVRCLKSRKTTITNLLN